MKPQCFIRKEVYTINNSEKLGKSHTSNGTYVISKKRRKPKMGPQCEGDCESPIWAMLDLLTVCSVTVLSICSIAEESDFYACVQTLHIACMPFQFSISVHICTLSLQLPQDSSACEDVSLDSWITYSVTSFNVGQLF